MPHSGVGDGPTYSPCVGRGRSPKPGIAARADPAALGDRGLHRAGPPRTPERTLIGPQRSVWPVGGRSQAAASGGPRPEEYAGQAGNGSGIGGKMRPAWASPEVRHPGRRVVTSTRKEVFRFATRPLRAWIATESGRKSPKYGTHDSPKRASLGMSPNRHQQMRLTTPNWGIWSTEKPDTSRRELRVGRGAKAGGGRSTSIAVTARGRTSEPSPWPADLR